jgi:hypothetical protein
VVEEATVVFGHELAGLVDIESAFGGPAVGVLADIAPELPIVLELSIPVLDGADGRLDLQNLLGYLFVAMVDRFTLFFMLNGEVAFAFKASIVARVSLLLDLIARPSHNFSDAVDESLIASLHIVLLKIGLLARFITLRPGLRIAACLDHRFNIPQVGVVACLVLKIKEFLCLFDIHE